MMPDLHTQLKRVARRLTFDRMLAALTLYYAAYISAGQSFHSNPAFVTVTDLFGSGFLRPEWAFSIPLAMAGAGLLIGEHRQQTSLSIAGGLAGCFAFSTACASCWISNPAATGVPIYSAAAGAYLVSVLFRSLGIQWVPLT